MATLQKPTPTELRANQRLTQIWEDYNFPLPTGSNPDPLADEVILAWAYVENKTGLDLDVLVDDTATAIIARRAVILRTLQQAVQNENAYLDQAFNDIVKSFTVPGYSETQFDPPRKLSEVAFMNPWPVLHDLLWAIATDEKKAELIAEANMDVLPASTVTEINWFSIPFRL
jgi:hypothetical protein